MDKIKILVTGADGQLGLTIKELFEGTDDFEFVFVNKEGLDITSRKKVRKVFSENNFDYCINCAAYTDVEQAEKTPEITYKVNSEGVKNIAESCKRYNVILIHISTDYVFDGKKAELYNIKDTPNPINEYGKSKLLGEKYIQEIAEKYFIIRTSWLYSKKHGHNFYKTILKKAKKGENISVVDNQRSCPTSCIDLTNFIFHLIENKLNCFGVLHFSGEKEMTWYEFALEILKENRLINQANIVINNNYITFAKRPIYSVLKNSKIK